MKNGIFYRSVISATITAIGIIVLGFCIKGGIDDFANKDRKVTVKGLAEKEVWADKVTWPIPSKVLGNNLSELYDQMAASQRTIKNFLIQNGIKTDEISINAPQVIDMSADQYNVNKMPYRYNVTSIVTVTSRNDWFANLFPDKENYSSKGWQSFQIIMIIRSLMNMWHSQN
jgi:hypothetical protein